MHLFLSKYTVQHLDHSQTIKLMKADLVERQQLENTHRTYTYTVWCDTQRNSTAQNQELLKCECASWKLEEVSLIIENAFVILIYNQTVCEHNYF